MNSLFKLKINNQSELEYQGPEGIHAWIWDNMITPNISSNNIRAYMRSKKHLNPIGHYYLYQFFMKFLDYCSDQLVTHIRLIDDNHLINKLELFSEFIASTNMTHPNQKHLENVYTLFSPEEKLQLSSSRYKYSKPQLLKHPLVECYLDFLIKNGVKQKTITNEYYNL